MISFSPEAFDAFCQDTEDESEDEVEGETIIVEDFTKTYLTCMMKMKSPKNLENG